MAGAVCPGCFLKTDKTNLPEHGLPCLFFFPRNPAEMNSAPFFETRRTAETVATFSAK